ncbi:winged helix-turn-helix transcriptional regulator [Pseudomonas sp. DWP3-1-2]|uniref:winged helix-turn-helix transcriptional regulator n=1 Tax=Pseudomonas sp. DWP3-1-2 TaxID=2804645 RepID=UPI003CF2552B
MTQPAETRSPLISTLIQARPGELMAVDCPSRIILSHVCSRWGVLVLVVLRGGMHRFSELRRKIGGVSEKMLSQTLQNLEHDGFVERKALPVVPPHVQYRLSPLGEEVALQVDILASWIEGNMPRIMEARRPAPEDQA